MAEPIQTLEMRGISKAFGGKLVNERIDLSLKSGEIVGLLGENGAGKTTLMNILFGLYQPESGEIRLNGRPVRFGSPREAMKAGIGMVHQHFMLVPNHSVAENLAAALPGTPFFRPLSWVRRQVKAYENQFKLGIDPDQPASELAAGELQRVEILKALLNGAELLILDEPTSVLSPQEAEELFAVLRGMAGTGKIIIIISHKLEEILALCQRVVVLRKGKLSGGAPTLGADKAELARMMVGRDVMMEPARAERATGELILSVEGLSVRGDHGLLAVKQASFEVRQGEIFGIAGVSGNGQRELAEAITGLRSAVEGRVMLDGRDVTRASVKQLSARGLSHIPEERMRFGIVPNLLLYENAVLKDYHTADFSDDIFLKQPAIRNFAEMIVENFRVAAPTINTPIKHLSGGNIQKLILGREISGDPTLLVAAHPTYGLDIGATEYVRNHLIKRRDAGGAVLLLSEDLEEIMSLSDRIAVMYQGRILAVIPRAQADLTAVGLLMAGVVSAGQGEGQA